MCEVPPVLRTGHLSRSLLRTIRHNEIRRPKTMREITIWHEGQAEREERRAQRVARAERRQREAADGGSGQVRSVEA